jgi:hypothetical protein
MFRLGALMLQSKDAGGFDLIERATVADPSAFVERAFDVLERHAATAGIEGKAIEFYDRHRDALDEVVRAAFKQQPYAISERNTVSHTERFVVPSISRHYLRLIKRKLAAHPEIECAHFVQRDVRFRRDLHSYLVAIRLKKNEFGVVATSETDRILESLAASLSQIGDVRTIVIGDDPLGKAIASVPDSLIYDTETRSSATPLRLIHDVYGDS